LAGRCQRGLLTAFLAALAAASLGLHGWEDLTWSALSERPAEKFPTRVVGGVGLVAIIYYSSAPLAFAFFLFLTLLLPQQ